jgi:hypothetical protein
MRDLLIRGSFLSFSITASIFTFIFLDEGLKDAFELFFTTYSFEPGTEFRASLTIFLILVVAQWRMFKEITILP